MANPTSNPRIPRTHVLLSLLNGLFVGFIWPPSAFCLLLPIALSPMMFVWLRNSGNRRGWLLVYVFFFCFSMVAVRWLWQVNAGATGKILVALAFLLIPLVQSIPFMLSAWVYRRWQNKISFLLVPLLAVGIEYLHNFWELGFTWLHMYLGLASSPIDVGAYSLAGPLGTTFLIYSTNLLLAYGYQRYRQGKDWKMVATVASVVMVLLFFPADKKNGEQGRTLKVAVAEPVYDPAGWNKNELYAHSRNIGEAIRIAAANEVELLVFPEGYLRDFATNPIILDTLDLNPAVRDIKEWCGKYNVNLVTGAIALKWEEGPEKGPTARKTKDGRSYDQLNVALCIDSNQRVQHRAKSRLVPFMERVPFLDMWGNLESLHLTLNQSSGSYGRGEGLKSFDLGEFSILPLICYESLFQPDLNSCGTDADVMVEISNEAWADGNYMSLQHAAYGRANAAIYGLPYLRASVGTGAQILKVPETVRVKTSFGCIIIASIRY